MTGPQHWAEADKLLTGIDACEYGCPHSGCPHEMRLIARAQAHATLALAAAAMFGYHDETIAEAEYQQWKEVLAP